MLTPCVPIPMLLHALRSSGPVAACALTRTPEATCCHARFGSSLYRASPRHRWFYYRDMNPGEALIFKQFDTADPAIVGCPHVAFADPSAENPVPRASAEIRAFAYWRA